MCIMCKSEKSHIKINDCFLCENCYNKIGLTFYKEVICQQYLPLPRIESCIYVPFENVGNRGFRI